MSENVQAVLHTLPSRHLEAPSSRRPATGRPRVIAVVDPVSQIFQTKRNSHTYSIISSIDGTAYSIWLLCDTVCHLLSDIRILDTVLCRSLHLHLIDFSWSTHSGRIRYHCAHTPPVPFQPRSGVHQPSWCPRCIRRGLGSHRSGKFRFPNSTLFGGRVQISIPLDYTWYPHWIP